MDIIMERYEELYARLDKAEQWLEVNNYTSWEQVREEDFKVYQLRKNIIIQIEVMQKSIHNKLGLIYG